MHMKKQISAAIFCLAMLSLHGCFSDDPPICGNGILEVGEQCDGDNYQQSLCQGRKDTYITADKAYRCNNCILNTDAVCPNIPNIDDPAVEKPHDFCGDNYLDYNELCDGAAPVSDETRYAYRCPSGISALDIYDDLKLYEACIQCQALDLDHICKYDIVKEPEEGRDSFCGNDILEEGEQCDGNEATYDPCGEGLILDKSNGSVCNQDCSIDTNKCISIVKTVSVCTTSISEEFDQLVSSIEMHVSEFDSDIAYEAGILCSYETLDVDTLTTITNLNLGQGNLSLTQINSSRPSQISLDKSSLKPGKYKCITIIRGYHEKEKPSALFTCETGYKPVDAYEYVREVIMNGGVEFEFTVE